jgi:hypothetical protein
MTWPPETLDDVLALSVSAWNLLGLPTMLVAVLIGTVAASRYPGSGPDQRLGRMSRRRVVRLIGMCHFGLACWGLTTVAGELWAYRTMGIFPSNPVTGLPGSLVAIAVDVPVGIGLWCLWRWARWGAVVLATIRVALAVIAMRYVWVHGAVVDLTEWPRFVVARAAPFLFLLVLLLPSTARAVKTPKNTVLEPQRGDLVILIAMRLFAIVLGSVVATDALDWTVRTVAEGLDS